MTPQAASASTLRDANALLAGLPEERAALIQRYLDERETLMLLHGSLSDVERAESLRERLQVFVHAIQQTGFARVVLTLRDAGLDPTLVVTAGLSSDEERDLRERPAPGEVWRRRLAMLEPFRISQSYYLDSRDSWIASEFGGGVPSALSGSEDSEWAPQDSLLVLLRSHGGTILATLLLDDPVDRRRPSLSRIRIVELFGQQVAYTIEQTQLVELAERRAERLQRLQEVGSMLVRSLDVRAIHRELGRQVLRTLPAADGVVLAAVNGAAGTVTTLHQITLGREVPPRTIPGADSVIGRVPRGERALRLNDYAAVRTAADVLDDGGPCGSAVVVPLRVGSRVIAVLAVRSAERAAFSEEDEELLVTIGAHAATAIANAELYAESERERRQSEALAEVARAVSESLRLSEVLPLILRHAGALLRAEGAAIALRNGDFLDIVAGVGSVDGTAGLRLPVNGSVVGRVLRTGIPAIVNDAGADPDTYRPTQQLVGIERALAVPLITGKGIIGVILVVNRAVEFAEEDSRVLQRLADHVGVAIVNARLFEEAANATREWRVAFDAIPIGMVVIDAAGRITRCNRSAVAMASTHSEAELVGADFHEAVLGVCRTTIPDSPVIRALAGSAGRDVCRSESRGRIFEVSASPHPSGGAVVTFEDVSTVHALEERHRRVIETAADAIVITDLDRRVSFANPAAHELLGLGPELVGMPVSEFVPEDFRAKVRDHEQAGFDGHSQRYECQVLRRDGDRRTVSVMSAPLRELGRVTGIVASLHDMTDERRARDALTQSETRYRNLFDTATDAIYTVDVHGTLTSANEATSRLAGAPREELLGRSLMGFIDPEAQEMVRDQFQAGLAGQSRRYEVQITDRAGRRRQVSVTNTPIRNGSRVVGLLGVARDVTEERAQARALAASEARYSNLVESAADAIFTVDEEGRFTSVNRALEKSTGRTREDLIGKPFVEVLAPEDREGAWPILARTLRGERERGEFRYKGRDGIYRFGSIITAPMFENGRVNGGLGVVRDVTDEKMLVEQLLQQEKLAAIGQLVSGVAHELNNPLAGVIAFAQLLLASPLVEDQRTAAETIHTEAKRAARIVTNLLTFARQHPPERSATDLNQVVRDTVELRRYALERDRVELLEDLDPHLPLTWADPFQLQQVLLNLVTNAEHAVANKTSRRIVVRTRAEGGLLVMSVEDTGPGIAAADVDRIFNPFYTTKAVGQGTGLGLSISDGIVREHGGRIRVTSPPGSGATIRVELPLTLPPQRKVQQVVPASRSVLVVACNAAVRGTLVAGLGVAGHRVDTATTAVEALAALRGRWYDAVLLHTGLKDLTAVELHGEVRARDPQQAARVAFLLPPGEPDEAARLSDETGRPCVSDDAGAQLISDILFAEAGA